MARLTPKQEAFAQGLARGEAQAKAFREAYPASKNWQPESVHQQASRLAHNAKIAARVHELRAPVVEAVRITQEERITTYLDIAARAKEAKDLQAETRAQDSITRVTGLFTAERQNNRSPIEDLDPGQRDALRRVIEAALEDAERDAAKARDDA